MFAIRTRAAVWFATGVVMTLLASVYVINAWQATAAPSNDGCSTVALPKPVRILDTRDAVSEPAGPNVGLAGPIMANASVKLQVSGPISQGALGTSTVVPTGASLINFNVTVLRNAAGGFVSLRPGDATGVPGTSSENVPANSAGSNNFGQVALGPTGNIDIYYGSAAGTSTELILDVISYCATDTVTVPTTTLPPGVTTTTTTTTTTAPPVINVPVQNWKIEWQGDQPGVTSSAPSIFDQVRFGITNNQTTSEPPGDNGNPSDGGDVSLVRSGEVCQGANVIKVDNGSFSNDPPTYTPIPPVSSWDFYDLTCDNNGQLISGKYRRTDGLTDTGIFQMYEQGTSVTPLPDPVIPPLPDATAGSACTSSDDLSDTTRKFEFTGTVPGVAPSPDNKISVNFAVADGAITNQSSVRHDGTDPPWTWAKGNTTIICGDRIMTVLMNNNQTTNPASPDRGLYYFQNVRLDSGDLIGEYSYDGDAPYTTDFADADDVGTFRTE